MKVQMKMSKNGCRMWVMKNAKPKFGIVYHERGGMLISYTSRLGNRYIYEFEEKTFSYRKRKSVIYQFSFFLY